MDRGHEETTKTTGGSPGGWQGEKEKGRNRWGVIGWKGKEKEGGGREGESKKEGEKEREGMEGGSRIPYTVTFVKAWLSPYTGNVRDGRYLYRVQLKNQECRFLSRLLYTPVVMGGTNTTRK